MNFADTRNLRGQTQGQEQELQENHFRPVTGSNRNGHVQKKTMETRKAPMLRTPLSLLNEICVKSQAVPTLEIIEEGPVHDRVYECFVKVTGPGYEAEGKPYF